MSHICEFCPAVKSLIAFFSTNVFNDYATINIDNFVDKEQLKKFV